MVTLKFTILQELLCTTEFTHISKVLPCFLDIYHGSTMVFLEVPCKYHGTWTQYHGIYQTTTVTSLTKGAKSAVVVSDVNTMILWNMVLKFMA